MIANGVRSALVLALAWCGLAAQTPQERLAEIRKQIREAEVFDFGKVRASQPIEHTFQYRNRGSETLEVKNVQLTPPLAVTRMNRYVRPGETAGITVSLGRPRQPGDFEGLIVVHFTKEDAPKALFRVQGRVVRAIDFEPLAAFFITTFKGESKQQSVEITNYEDTPLTIYKTEHNNSRFTTDLSPLEPGRRFKLTITVKDSAPAGKASEAIALFTSSGNLPVIRIPVNIQVRERVYTFPDSIALGLIDTARLKTRRAEASFASQSLMVYERNGTDFQIEAETDLPFLRLTKRQANLKDRFEVRLDVVPEQLKAGPVKGTIRITTNDAEFPRLEIPITGEVSGDWQD